MLYIIGEYMRLYVLYETNTESRIGIKENQLIAIMKRKWAVVKNAVLDSNDKIKVSDWYKQAYELNENKKYTKSHHVSILLGQVAEDRYKIVEKDQSILYTSEERVKQLTAVNKIANAELVQGKYEPEIKAYDTNDIDTQCSFIEYIDNEYRKFIAKSKMVGLDTSFQYTIEGNEVKMFRYTGNTEKVIVPRFVTAIESGVFFNKKIRQLILNEGLKYIGSRAFINNRLEQVEIPKTVVFIGELAFSGNNLFRTSRKGNKEFNPEKLIIQNKKALIIDDILKIN